MDQTITAAATLALWAPQLAAWRAQDRAEMLALMRKTEGRDADLMRRLSRLRQFTRARLPHYELAYIGLTFEDRYSAEERAAMGRAVSEGMDRDQAARLVTHPGRAWE